MKCLTDNINIQIICHAEDMPVKGNYSCLDPETDAKEEKRVLEKLEYNPWAWCCVEVKGEFKGIFASDYLGGCSYEGENDFIDNSVIYYDMVDNVKKQIQETINSVQGIIL